VSAVSNPDTLAQLALQDLQSDRLEAAEAKCLRALSADRQHVQALSILGLVLHARGRHEDAIRIFNALTLQEPNKAEHWTNLGTALRPTRRYGQALAAYVRALQLGGESAGRLYNIGLAQIDLYDFNEAYATLTRALGLAPDEARVRRLLAKCCHEAGDFEEARAILEDWPKFQGMTLDESEQIAYLLVTMGDSRRAEPLLLRISSSAGGAGPSSLIGVRVLERVNRLREARAALDRFRASAGAQSSDPDLLLTEAVITEREGNYEEARALLARALESQTDMPRRHNLLFLLGRVLDALGRYDEAYAALEEAHHSQVAFFAAVLGQTPANDSGPLAVIARTGSEDSSGWDEEGAPAMEESPIFIVAFPRSGTTLLEVTLDAHPQLASMDEQPFLHKANEEVAELGLGEPAELGKLTATQRRDLRERYWQRVRGRVELGPGQRLVDKNPLNLLLVPLIRRLFPHAPIVLTVRHPCDTLLSCFMQHFRAPNLALMCRDLPTLAAGYRGVFDFWYAQWPLLRPRSYELKYESFVANFDTEVRRLSEFLQLPWNAAMLAPAEHARRKGFISTPSYVQVVQPVSSKSVGRWKSYERHFADVLPLLRPDLERWGYDA